MVRPSCYDKINMKQGSWNDQEEDAQMLAFVTKQPTSSWQVGAPRKPGLRRCAKNCKLRKTNVIRNDNTRHENFTPQEEELIIKLHSAIGSRVERLQERQSDRTGGDVTDIFIGVFKNEPDDEEHTEPIRLGWPIIAQQLPGRTDNDVKNYWNTKLKKKLSSMGIDPVTHRPFSQMLADYGNISGLTRTKTRMGSLGRDNKNTFFITSQDQTQQIPTHEAHLFPSFNNNVKMEPPEVIKTDSLDLLTQLQAITHGKESSTNHETSFTQFHVSVASSSSSSSSSCSTLNHEMTAQQPFNWRDFLVENAQDGNASNDEKLTFEGNTPLMNGVTETMENACDGSFVEGMLDGEDDMFLDFPGLLGEQSYH